MLNDDDVCTASTPEEQPSEPVMQASENAAVTTPSAILLVRPELLLGGTQVATNILSGIPIGSFTAHLCN